MGDLGFEFCLRHFYVCARSFFQMKPTDLEKAQAKYYASMPELIIEFGPWETVKHCAKCGGVIKPKDSCLFATENGFNPFVDDFRKAAGSADGGREVKLIHVSCPHCGVTEAERQNFWFRTDKKSGGKKDGNWYLDCLAFCDPLKYNVIFKRKVIIEKEKKNFWGTIINEEKFFWEYVEEKEEKKNDEEGNV